MTALRHNVFHYILTAFLGLGKELTRSFIWILVGFSGLLIFQTRKTPFDIVLGLPLLLVGAGLSLNGLSSILFSLFSPKYNRGTCPICNR